MDGFRAAFDWSFRMTRRGFPRLKDPVAGLAAILPSGHRIFIAANDFAHVDPEILEWADVVGQVNVDPDLRQSAKVLPIGPSFGTPWSSASYLAAFVVQSGLMTDPPRVPAMLRDYLRHQRDREPISSYTPASGSLSNIFFVANFWGNAEETNERRLRFLRAVQRVPEVSLEGGFWSRKALPPEFADFHTPVRVDHGSYLDRVRRSLIVFNTPAVHDCLGWKLGEFLALGKAILSTPLGREMPGQFEPGEHFHQVANDEDAMVQAVEQIWADKPYRVRLEHNARAYWEEYLAPVQVARRLVKAAIDRS